MAFEACDSMSDISDIEIFPGLSRCFVFAYELLESQKSRGRRSRGPGNEQIERFPQLPNENRIHEGNEKKENQLLDLRPAEPRIRTDQIGQNCPYKEANQWDPNARAP